MINRIIFWLKDYFRGVPTLGGRSSQWPRVRADFVKKFPLCQLCGGKKSVEVHHKQPFHLHPELELDENNLISLCEGNKSVVCHRFFGHLGNYKNFNSSVVEDVKIWNKKLKTTD